ncbi:phospholipid/cholesterol/gamma-HCH transport system substrate-binding protein [Angulomicrobium tetraedrale]|uniref:Phospholipid/cholesterol/gamma-HCH transport system substrate-binding protein n=1 Tax=Ancylobacter tetraedralis TaxID=217068 RepID=A0A839ZDY3_9HYPH|nr:MlaD family protein [Ancylobacter tetraedralis]MBB3772842.1 phospholipid/cholesterol/gamma-HCH transport system substrate-binding protein [Ancylobacter tetraedralis]
METRANYIIIGLFTLAVIAAGFGFVWWFNGSNSRGPRASYDVVFSGPVSGLQTGSAVTFNGIPVGEVTRLRLDKEDPRKVVATVAVQPDTPVKSDTRAELDAQVLTGLASVGLIGGSATATPLPTPTEGQLPRIEADASAVQDLMQGARQVMGRVDDIARRVDDLLRDNEGKISSVIDNVDKFTTVLGNNADTINGLITDVGAAARRIDQLAGNLDKTVTSVEPDKVRAIVDNVAQFSTQLEGMTSKVNAILDNVNGLTSGEEGKGMFNEIAAAAAEVRKLAANLDTRTAELTANLNEFTGPGLRQYQALAVDGRRTLAEIERVFRKLESNPRQFLFGGSSVPGYTGR